MGQSLNKMLVVMGKVRGRRKLMQQLDSAAPALSIYLSFKGLY